MDNFLHTNKARGALHATWYTPMWLKVKEQATSANLIGLLGAVFALFCLLVIHDPTYLNMRLPLYVIVVIWVVVQPRMALYLLPIAIPWGSLDTSSGLSPKGYDADILVALLAASWLMSFPLRRFVVPGSKLTGPLDREYSAIPRYLLITSMLLLLVMLLSTAVASSLSDSLKQVIKWSEVVVLLLLATQYIRTRRQVWTLVVIICLAALSQAILGYAQNFLDLGPTAFIRGDTLRVYGTLDQPNPFAGYINVALTITIALTLFGRSVSPRILAGATTLLLAGVEYFTQSKGGWLALAAAIVFIVAVGFPRLRIFIGACAIVLIAIIGGYIAGVFPEDSFFQSIAYKMGFIDISFVRPTDQSYANSERLAHWFAGIRMFLDHPFLGVGIGNYADAYPQYAPGIFVVPLGHAHNYYINIAAEAGILGLITFVLFLLAIFLVGGRSFYHINKRYQQAKEQFVRPHASVSSIEAQNRVKHFSMLAMDRALAIGLLAALLSVCVHNVVDNLYVHSMTSLFILLVVLLICLDKWYAPA